MRFIHQNTQIFLFCLLIMGIQSVYSQNLSSFKNQKPFTISGSLSATTQFYTANGIANRRQPFTWYLTGSPTIKIYGIAMPFSFTVSEQERNYSQPFNRYGVSPYYKWIKIHAGYRNVRFSDFTLGGANFLGGGIELTPKFLRLGFVYGQFARRVFEDNSGTDPRYSYLRPTYQRLGYGGKLGFGKSKAYLDFSFFKAEDVVESIYKPSLKSGITPMENLAAGIKSHIGVLKNKVTFDVEVAASILTKDIRKTDIQTDEPLLQNALSFMPINSSSAFFKAIKASNQYRIKFGNIRLDYQRIDPGYRSLGAYFFQNDIEQLTFSPQIILFKNKLQLMGSLGRSHDNLNNKKVATTNRTIGAVTVSATPFKNLNLTTSYSNFGIGQSCGIGDIFNDSLAISIVNSSISGMANYSINKGGIRHGISMNVVRQNTNDQNQFSNQLTGASSFIANLGYTHTNKDLKLNGAASGSYVSIFTNGKNTKAIGPSINVSKEWTPKHIRTTLNHNSQLRTLDNQKDGFISNSGFTVALTLKKQTISVAGFYLFNQYKAQADGVLYRNFAEYRSTITYGIRF